MEESPAVEIEQPTIISFNYLEMNGEANSCSKILFIIITCSFALNQVTFTMPIFVNKKALIWNQFLVFEMVTQWNSTATWKLFGTESSALTELIPFASIIELQRYSYC